MENLNYKVEKKPNCVMELDIEVPWENVSPKLESVYVDIQKHVRMPGFRKGKVPVKVIKEKYSEEAKHELVNKITPDVLGNVLEKENINPVTTPMILDYKIELEQPLNLKVAVEIYPEVTLKKYKKLKLDKKDQSIDEKDIDKTIETFRDRNASLQVKDGVLDEKDFAVVSIKAYLDEKEVKLGLPEQTIIEIGADSMLPGFDENIKGMKKGESKEFDYDFPADFPKEDLQGKKAKFTVDVKEVKQKNLPEIKEVAESLGFDSEEKLRENVKENLEKQVENSVQNNLEEQIINSLVEKHDFEIPEGLIVKGLEKDRKQMENYIKSQGGDPSMMDETKLREKVVKEIKAGILLSTIASEEKIEITEEDRKAEEDKVMKMLGGESDENREKAKQFVNDNVILTRKVFDFIKENAKIKAVEPEKENK
jgi:trigger factor